MHRSDARATATATAGIVGTSSCVEAARVVWWFGATAAGRVPVAAVGRLPDSWRGSRETVNRAYLPTSEPLLKYYRDHMQPGCSSAADDTPPRSLSGVVLTNWGTVLVKTKVLRSYRNIKTVARHRESDHLSSSRDMASCLYSELPTVLSGTMRHSVIAPSWDGNPCYTRSLPHASSPRRITSRLAQVLVSTLVQTSNSFAHDGWKILTDA
ncbi:hypothetical protein V8F33_006540 [Rhypophila sp. PSN 637]